MASRWSQVHFTPSNQFQGFTKLSLQALLSLTAFGQLCSVDCSAPVDLCTSLTALKLGLSALQQQALSPPAEGSNNRSMG